MLVSAKLKSAALSAQKGRLVADLIRSMSVEKAIQILEYTPKKGAKIIKKLLESAIANAEHNNGAEVDELYVHTIYIDEATTLKRIQPRAKGRANRILKRTSHITIKVSDKE